MLTNNNTWTKFILSCENKFTLIKSALMYAIVRYVHTEQQLFKFWQTTTGVVQCIKAQGGMRILKSMVSQFCQKSNQKPKNMILITLIIIGQYGRKYFMNELIKSQSNVIYDCYDSSRLKVFTITSSCLWLSHRSHDESLIGK